ncbi:hypothetical protein BASA81_001399 [Batrachochytrium salamandrivorans]|nr:hypothetical protein BASA81_001399 [Batrachochytrium salamandrivorans]
MSSTPTPSSMVTRGTASAAKQGSKQASEQASEQDSEQAPKHIKVAAAAAIEQPKKRRLPKSATPTAASGEGLDATPKPKLPTKGKRVQLSVFAQLQTPLLFVAPPALVAVKTAPNSTKLREDARGVPSIHKLKNPPSKRFSPAPCSPETRFLPPKFYSEKGSFGTALVPVTGTAS